MGVGGAEVSVTAKIGTMGFSSSGAACSDNVFDCRR